MAQDYSQLSKEELIRVLRRRDRMERRFGLVWERDEIEHERSLNADFVALEPIDSLCVGQNPFQNLLIEGSNFDALRYLRMTHTGKIKCILIDPPYNTGQDDFIYNDKFVNKDDSYRHSKWLEIMFQTLSLARDLLTDDGVIFVHIGEEEIHRLGCLMEQIFPNRKVATFVWRRRSGANDSKEYFVSKDHEYVLCYANPNFSFEGDVKSTEAYKNPDNDKDGAWVNSDLTQRKTYKQRRNGFFPIQNPENGIWYAASPDNVWAFASEERLKSNQKVRSLTMEQIIAKKKVIWPQNDRFVVYETLS